MKATHKLFMTFLLIHNQVINGYTNEWSFLSELQERCPYTSFCDVDANLTMPTDAQDNLRPCCQSCSCSPDCVEANNCCYDTENVWTHERKCMSSITSSRPSFIAIDDNMYFMIYRCQGQDCSQNGTNIEPVYSPSNKQIFVNSYCAYCHNINDSIQWRQTISCPQARERSAMSDVSSNLLHGNTSQVNGCFMSSIPPKGYDLKHLECRGNVIRECNVTGTRLQKTPFWDYCLMFNATFTMNPEISFGNVFCYICNVGDEKQLPYLCPAEEPKSPYMYIYLTHVLDHTRLDMDTDLATDKSQAKHCGPNEALVQSFKTECRKLECPWGQFRLHGKCDFYSKEWIGEKFSVLLKLRPVNPVNDFPVTLLTNKSVISRHDKRCRWLKRKAMKHWNVKLLYHPTNDRKFVQFLVVIATHPSTSVHPNLMKRTIEKSLKEIWIISGDWVTIRLKVSINEHQHYEESRVPTKSNFKATNNISVSFIRGKWEVDGRILEDKDDLIPISIVVSNDFIDIINLSRLFFCYQVALQKDEHGYRYINKLEFVVTNKTLYSNEYRVATSGDIYVCVDEFPASKCARNVLRLRSCDFFVVTILVQLVL